jgi:pimeloyl-ACP methyl ester carboxylesterase
MFATLVNQAQTLDTIVDIGKYKLHFNIVKGKGTPILFESGSGNNMIVWKDLLKPISDRTSATLITYERAGLGKSVIKDSTINVEKNGIIDNVEALEVALKKLGYDNEIIIVAHSLGAFYSSLYSSRNPSKVKSVLFIDASLPAFYSKNFIDRLNKLLPDDFLSQVKTKKVGLYYEIKNIDKSLEVMRKTIFPGTIPVIDLIAETPYNPLKNDEDRDRWIDSHKQFTEGNNNRKSIIVNGAGHYIFNDKPLIVINAIVKLYLNNNVEN